MALPPLATVADLATWLNVTIPDGNARAAAVLAAASGFVRTAAAQTWVDAQGNLVDEIPEDALTITKTAASRGWLNPAGTKESRTGPWSASWSDDATGVMLTDAEVASLAGLRPGPSGSIPGLTSVRVVAPAATNASRVVYGDAYSELCDGDL